MLEAPDSIPVLEVLDLEWASQGGAWKERHKRKIECACEDLGIQCRVGDGDRELQF